MSIRRDFQKNKVYRWEDTVVGPRSDRVIRFDEAQTFVDGVWLSMGLIGPPRCMLFDREQKCYIATGSRMELRLQIHTKAWVVLHEIAHALGMHKTDGGYVNPDDGHGPKFVGHYIKLLDRVLGIPLALTMYTLEQHGVKFKL